MKITTVISDLGNVLIDYDNGKFCLAISAIVRISPDAVHAALFAGDPYLTELYARGEIDTAEFKRRFDAALAFCGGFALLPEDEFRRLYCDVFDWNTEVRELYARLRRQGLTMTALTNVEPLRWARMEEMGVMEMFDYRLVSFEERLLKPSEELMVRALDRSGCQAEDAVFIDDREPNLVPAARLGINVVHYRSFSQLVDDLRRLGLPVGD